MTPGLFKETDWTSKIILPGIYCQNLIRYYKTLNTKLMVFVYIVLFLGIFRFFGPGGSPVGEPGRKTECPDRCKETKARAFC